MTKSAVPEDVAIVELMRSVMQERSDPMPAAPGWGKVSTRLQRIRRRRRQRTVAGLGAGLLVLATGGIVIHTEVGRREAPPVSATLLGKPVRGSLAGDKDWLEALRRRAVGGPNLGFGGQSWRPGEKDDAQVIFAGDVDGYRLALVAGGWEQLEPAQAKPPVLLRWFVGPADAPAANLRSGAVSVASTSLAVQVVQPDSIPSANGSREGVAVAVSAGPVDVRLAGPASYPQDGQITLPRGPRLSPREPGVYVVPIPADGAYRLLVNGRGNLGNYPISDQSFRAESSNGDLSLDVSTGQWYLPKVVRPLFGGPTPPRQVLMYAARVTQQYSGLPVRDSKIGLLGATPHYDADGGVSEWTVLTVITAPSGTQFIGVSEVSRTGRGIGAPGSELEGWTTVPAGTLDAAAMAWATGGIDEATVSPIGRIAFLGPRKAVTAEILGVRGQVVGTVALVRRTGSGDSGSAGMKAVRFLDAAGRTLTTAQVQPYPGGNWRRPWDQWPSPPGTD
jgi:hypothetical protein